jgi:hypothetical protein
MASKLPNKLRFDAFSRPVVLADIRKELPEEQGRSLQTAISWAVLAVMVVTACIIILPRGISGLESTINVLIVAAVVTLTVVTFLPFILKKDLRDILRIKRFAEENGLDFMYDEKDIERMGMIFNKGSERVLRVGFAAPSQKGRVFEIANYSYVTGSGKHRSENRWGFVRIILSRQLPRMVIDGKRNNFIVSNLPELFDSSQRLRLEGNFNDFFDIYVPAGYENDALYVLTPDIMALLVDNAAGYDVEITGNQLFIYDEGGFNFRDPSTIEKLVNLAKSFQGEFEMQTDYYADDRVGNHEANIVAEPGRTLKGGFNWTGIFLLLVFLYYMYGSGLPIPDGLNLLLVFVMFGGVLVVAIREILRLKKIKK